MSLYEVIGTKQPDYLLADPVGGDKIAISVKPGNGVIKRGTVMYREESGMWSPAAAENAIDTNHLCVIDETVDSNANATVAEDAAAYRAGKLIRGKVVLKADGEVTDAIALVLRKQGIVLDYMVPGAEHNNSI